MTDWLLHASLLSSQSPRLVMLPKQGGRKDKEGGEREGGGMCEQDTPPTTLSFTISFYRLDGTETNECQEGFF